MAPVSIIISDEAKLMFLSGILTHPAITDKKYLNSPTGSKAPHGGGGAEAPLLIHGAVSL